MNIRCSSLDRLFQCPQSVLHPGRSPVDRPNLAARTGSCVHEIMACIIEGRDYDLEAMRLRHGLDLDTMEAEVVGMVREGQRFWSNTEHLFCAPSVEASAFWPIPDTEHVLDGTLDVAGVNGNDCYVIDWKTSRKDVGYQQQLMGYAWLVWQVAGRPAQAEVRTVIVWLRLRDYTETTITPDMLEQWEHDLAKNQLASPTYNPGSHCPMCPRNLTCEAWLDYARSIVIATGGNPALGDRLAQATAEDAEDPEVQDGVMHLLAQARILDSLSAQAKDVLRTTIERIGPVRVGHDGTSEIGTIETTRKEVDVAKAVPILRNYLSDKQIFKSCRLSLSAILKSYGRLQDRGAVHGAREDLLRLLDERGAITYSTGKRLNETAVRPPEEIDDADAP